LVGLFFDPEDGRDIFLRNAVDFNGTQGVTTQKAHLFITTAVRTSNTIYHE
jgi:hypothetical protein